MLFIFLALFALVPTVAPTLTGFVTTSGTHFSLNGCPFYVAGGNAWYMNFVDSTMRQSVLQNANALGMNVLRTLAFIDIGSLDGTVPSVGEGQGGGAQFGVYYQYWDTTTNKIAYNDGPTGLQNLDATIRDANQKGIRLIITLTNNWFYEGGVDQYLTWFGLTHHDQFYTNTNVIQAYKNWVSHIVTRVNTYTGVAYKNDPTIFAWELINEPECYGNEDSFPQSGSCTPSTTIYNWANTMSTYIHSLNPNHMIAIGDEGFYKNTTFYNTEYYNGINGDFDKFLTLPHISFGTYHLYPDGMGQSNSFGTTFIAEHIDSSRKANKPVIMEEYGIEDTVSNRATYYTSWLQQIENSDAAGDMVWFLAGAQDGGNPWPDTGGYRITNDGSATATAIKNHNAHMTAKSVCAVSCTVITSNSASPIHDASGNQWTVTADSKVAVNGNSDPTTNGVIKLAMVGNVIWQEINNKNWYSKTSPTSSWTSATTTDPTTACLASTVIPPVISLASFSASSVPRGGSVTVKFTVEIGTAALVNGNYGYSISPAASYDWSSVASAPVIYYNQNLAAKSHTAITSTATILSTAPTGTYWLTFTIWDSSWNNLYWATDVITITIS